MTKNLGKMGGGDFDPHNLPLLAIPLPGKIPVTRLLFYSIEVTSTFITKAIFNLPRFSREAFLRNLGTMVDKAKKGWNLNCYYENL